MVLGGIVVASFFAKRSRIGMIIVSSLVFGALSIGMGLSPTIWLFFGFMFLIGLGVPFFSTPSMTLLQETVEPERQGRVFGFLGIVMALAMPFGMVIFGPLADVVPIEWLLVGCRRADVRSSWPARCGCRRAVARSARRVRPRTSATRRPPRLPPTRPCTRARAP